MLISLNSGKGSVISLQVWGEMSFPQISREGSVLPIPKILHLNLIEVC